MFFNNKSDFHRSATNMKASKNPENWKNCVLWPFPAKNIRIPYVFWPELAGGTPSPDSPATHQLQPQHKESLCFWLEMATVHDFPEFLDFCCFFFLKPVTTQLAAWWKATPVLPAQSFFFPPGSSFEILLLTLP